MSKKHYADRNLKFETLQLHVGQVTWDMPVATKCEKCGSTLFRKGSKLYCAKEGCGFEMPVPKKD